MTQHIYGGSDDLIEAEGDVREEWNVYPESEDDAARITVVCADGDIVTLLAWYGDLPDSDDGGWCVRVQPDSTSDEVVVTHHPARGEDQPRDADDCPGYSEKVTIDAEVASVRVVHSDVDRTERA